MNDAGVTEAVFETVIRNWKLQMWVQIPPSVPNIFIAGQPVVVLDRFHMPIPKGHRSSTLLPATILSFYGGMSVAGYQGSFIRFCLWASGVRIPLPPPLLV